MEQHWAYFIIKNIYIVVVTISIVESFVTLANGVRDIGLAMLKFVEFLERDSTLLDMIQIHGNDQPKN